MTDSTRASNEIMCKLAELAEIARISARRAELLFGPAHDETQHANAEMIRLLKLALASAPASEEAQCGRS